MASNNDDFSENEGGAMLTPDDNAQPSFDNDEIEDGEELEEQPEKKIVKKGAKKALESTGVPSGAADTIVEKADESGALDKVVENVKKKKMAIVAKIIASFIPILIWGLGIILILIIIITLAGGVFDKLDFITTLLSSDKEEITKYLDEAANEALSGEFFYQMYMEISLPNYGYVDGMTDKLSGDDLKEKRSDEIDRISDIISAIVSPAYYYDSMQGNSISIKDISTLNDIKNFFGQGEEYRIVAEHACMLAYAGLKNSSGQSYYESKFSKDANLSENYSSAWDKISSNECGATSGFSNKISIDELFKDIEITPGKPIGDIVKNILKKMSDKISGSDNKINKSLISNIGDYEFDKKTYEEFLKSYYADKFLSDLKNDSLPEDKRISKDNFVSGTVSTLSTLKSTASSGLEKHYEDATGSGYNYDLISNLSSMYGGKKCAILEEYNPLTHEYVISKGIEDDEIHSVSAGEVVSVVYSGENIYSKYDSKAGKCLCNGIECENSNGSEVKIKFTYDEIEYIAIYSNLAEIRVDVGDQVEKGDVIATEGNSGCTNTKKLTFKIISENGISYNPNELVQECSSFTNTASLCNFQNLKVNLHDCNDELIKTNSFYDYIKEELYSNFKVGIDNEEFLKAATLITVTETLKKSNYQVGTTELDIKKCNYVEPKISEAEYETLDKATSVVSGQVITYANEFANVKYSNMCTRGEKDKNANSVYNEFCISEALELSSSKSYKEILKIYYPNFAINDNYCNYYASRVNAYSIDNNKPYLSKGNYSVENIEKINNNLKTRVESARFGTRAATVEAARILALTLKYRIPYKNGGKYFELGFNTNWYEEGLDSSGFVSWALKNGGAQIEKSMTPKELITNNVVGSLKINASLYKYYDKIQVGDFAYKDSKIGIIIGKNDGNLYVAEADLNKGLIVSTITSYGESDSNYSHIYYADDYYSSAGNITSMW